MGEVEFQHLGPKLLYLLRSIIYIRTKIKVQLYVEVSSIPIEYMPKKKTCPIVYIEYTKKIKLRQEYVYVLP